MARVRRKAAAATRVNFELAGIAALGLAVLLAVALVLPSARTGAAGGATAAGLHAVFGGGAALFPCLIALIGAIVFLEINVPRMIATLGSAAVGFFILIDTALGPAGGMLGRSLDGTLVALVGDVGEKIVLILAGVSIAVWITNVSVKKLIGWCLTKIAALRPAPGAPRGTAPASASGAGPRSLREAFHLPVIAPKPSRAAVNPVSGATPAPVAPPSPMSPAKPVFDVEEDEYVEDPDADEDDYDDEDDEYDDEDELAAVGVIVARDAEPSAASVVTRIPSPAAQAPPARVNAGTYLGGADANGAHFGDAPDGDGGEAVAGEYEPAGARRAYRLPDLSLFDVPQAQHVDESNRAQILEDTLASFGVGAKVMHIERGPSITRYELRPERGVKISRISALTDDLALALAATSVRIEAPIPGKSAVGIEVPNATVSIVAIREILEALPQRGVVPPLNMALGKDITGRVVFGDLGKMPHLLVAGATGSGKSVCLNCIIATLLVNATPDQVQLLMIDPKRVELTVYNGIPHLIKEVITDAKLAAGALFEMTKEMDARYERFAKAGVRKIEEFNAKFPDEKLPYVVIIIDELADLMLIAPARVETTICRIAQLARATGIHLIVATQRPSVDVITGIIKANIPSRIAFAVSSQVDSRTILDMGGAERLLGRGDMLYLPIDAPKPVRSQGALVTSAEIGRLVEFWAAQARPENLLDVEVVPIDVDEDAKSNIDPLCYDAAKFIIETNYASTAQLQSQFSIGHPRAVRLMKQLEDFKVVGAHEGTKPRKILLGLMDLEIIAPRLGKTEKQPELF
jgi:DNA segregation ATPase FtsK/SpoIIIE-like protein